MEMFYIFVFTLVIAFLFAFFFFPLIKNIHIQKKKCIYIEFFFYFIRNFCDFFPL